MTEGLPAHDSPPEQEPTDESWALRSREDWQTEVNRLEAQRAQIQEAMGDQAERLAFDRDFNFLLGKIQVAHEQLIAHTIDEDLDQAVEDFKQ